VGEAPRVAEASSAPAAAAVDSGLEVIPHKVTVEGKAMGTHLNFTAFTSQTHDEAAVRALFEAAIVEFQRIEALMTTWRPGSDLSKVNDAAGKHAVVVSRETFDVVAESLRASELSHGAFDITFESLHGLWKFDQDLDPHPPSESDIKARLSLVNYRHVHLDAQALSVLLDTPGVRISLGGIAKGYAVDRAVALLDKSGLSAFFVQAGGDLFTRGRKPAPACKPAQLSPCEWTAGIRDPRGADGRYFATLLTSDHAFSTAGDYERSYIVAGKRYHHIIDPRTGAPATASRSVTVWAPSALVADELDDAVFILGPERGLPLIESTPGAGAVVVDAKNNVWISERLRGKVQLTGVPSEGL